MSDKESQVLPVTTEAVSKPLDFGTAQLEPSARKKRTKVSAVPSDVAKDVIAAAQGIRDRHKELFTADRKLKDRASRLFHTVLPPRPGRPGRKRIASVTRAIRLQRKLKRENPNAKPGQIWAKVYPKVIPNYANLTNDARWNEQQRLRHRVHSRKRQQQRRHGKI